MSSMNHMVNRYPTPDSKEPLWSIEKIEDYFNSKELPQSVQLDDVTQITDVKAFIDRHIGYLKHNDHKPTFYIYYERLKLLATKI